MARFTVVLFLLALFSPTPLAARAPDAAGGYDVLVVAHVDGLTDEAMARLSKAVLKERGVSIEYSCVWSGIVVLKYNDASASEKADLITMARRTLDAAAITGQVEFLHTHAEPTGPGKC